MIVSMTSKLMTVTARVSYASFVVLAAIAATPVWAQAEQRDLTPAPETGRWVGLLVAIFLFAGLCIGCYMTPKRTHQD